MDGERALQTSTGDSFLSDVLDGLSRERKSLPCKYFYDRRGSALFDAICELEEYYPTRTETAILHRHAADFAELAGPGAAVVELGSGSSVKVRILLDALETPAAYVPVDISREHLLASAARLAGDYPELTVVPVAADYVQGFPLPPVAPPERILAFFPGSTIGNFDPGEAAAFLGRLARRLGTGSRLLIGVDLKKRGDVLEAAYNDARGVTAAFNLNLLARINRELDGTFDLESFAHHAFYDESLGRIEMHLVSRRAQTVAVGRRSFRFRAGETIHTENSWKYALPEFERLAQSAGWRTVSTWTDATGTNGAGLFGVLWLQVS
ncbi:L-histidine N(alpha)-methyltransferase [Azospirillum sp. sgz301742]